MNKQDKMLRYIFYIRRAARDLPNYLNNQNVVAIDLFKIDVKNTPCDSFQGIIAIDLANAEIVAHGALGRFLPIKL